MTKFQKARQVMGKILENDEDLYFGYQSNVAMLLHDRYGITEHKERNEAAKEILSLIFSIAPTATIPGDTQRTDRSDVEEIISCG